MADLTIVSPPRDNIHYVTSSRDLFRQILFNEGVEDRDDIYSLLYVQLLIDNDEMESIEREFTYIDSDDNLAEHLLTGERIKQNTVLNRNTKKRWDNKQCGICLDDIKCNEWVRTLGCNHFFHKKCVDPWIVKKQNNSCPLCRKKVI